MQPTGHSTPDVRYDGERVLGTGGASFIGSHLCSSWFARAHAVTVADDLSSGDLDAG